MKDANFDDTGFDKYQFCIRITQYQIIEKQKIRALMEVELSKYCGNNKEKRAGFFLVKPANKSAKINARESVTHCIGGFV